MRVLSRDIRVDVIPKEGDPEVVLQVYTIQSVNSRITTGPND